MSFRLDYLYTSIIQRAGGKGEHLGETGRKRQMELQGQRVKETWKKDGEEKTIFAASREYYSYFSLTWN